MKLLQVNYRRELPNSDEEQAQRLLAAAEEIAKVSGLLWKIWLYDDESHLAGGIYLFDTEANARAWGDGPMEPALAAFPGFDAVTKHYFDVDETLSAITNGPLPTAGK